MSHVPSTFVLLCQSLKPVLVVSDLLLAFEWADQNNESAGQIE
jgi:hypothetical protein